MNRLAAGALALVIAGSVTLAPCAAAERAPAPRRSLDHVSPESIKAIVKSAAPVRKQDTEATSPGSFFRTKKGGIALALVAAGVGFTVWSISHDRKPVKSPVR